MTLRPASNSSNLIIDIINEEKLKEYLLTPIGPCVDTL